VISALFYLRCDGSQYSRGFKVKMPVAPVEVARQLPSVKQKCIVLFSRYYHMLVDISQIKFRICNNIMFSILSPKCRFKVPENFLGTLLSNILFVRMMYWGVPAVIRFSVFLEWSIPKNTKT
jgi:hypothetical protein